MSLSLLLASAPARLLPAPLSVASNLCDRLILTRCTRIRCAARWQASSSSSLGLMAITMHRSARPLRQARAAFRLWAGQKAGSNRPVALQHGCFPKAIRTAPTFKAIGCSRVNAVWSTGPRREGGDIPSKEARARHGLVPHGFRAFRAPSLSQQGIPAAQISRCRHCKRTYPPRLSELHLRRLYTSLPIAG